MEMDKKEFRAKAKELGKVVSKIEENSTKFNNEKRKGYDISVSDIISKKPNGDLNLGPQKNLRYFMCSLEDILKQFSKK